MTKFLGPYFSYPKVNFKLKETTPDFNLFLELRNLFSRIPSGGTVRGALYMWNQEASKDWKKGGDDLNLPFSQRTGSPQDLTDVFVDRASKCDTKIIIDSYSLKNHAKTMSRFREEFGERNVIIDNRSGMSDPEIRMDFAKKSEAATEGYMHDKFFLFSELEGIGKYVIVQMTANINYTQYHQYNNILVIYDDKYLYDIYVQHWDDLYKGVMQRNMWSLKRKIFPGASAGSATIDENGVWFFPRRACPVEKQLKHIIKTVSPETEIDIAMSFLTRRNFSKLLIKLKRLKCNIRVIMSEEFQNRNTITRFKEAKIPYHIIQNHILNQDRNYKDEEGNPKVRDNWRGRMHHKFMLIKHQYKKMVWTGSYNFTHPGLRLNDETAVKLVDAELYDNFKVHFERLWTRKKPKKIKTLLM